MLVKFIRGVKQLFSRLRRDRKGAALVEYALLVAGISLISLVAVATLGHKTQNLIGSVATILPGAHADDNGSLAAGRLVETKLDANKNVVLDVDTIVANGGTKRLGNNLGVNLDGLLVDTGGP
jgi:Flp pilus assembly pilin Flp